MDNRFLNIITLVIAVWGALLSTILAFREAFKDKRKLRMLLEYVTGTNLYRLVITNVGHRPITIEQIAFAFDVKAPVLSLVRKDLMWSDEEDHLPPQLPLTLDDGELAIFHISRMVSEAIDRPNQILRIKVFDAEGQAYSKYSVGEYDPGYGKRGPRYKFPGIIKSFLSDLKWKYYFWRSDK